MSKVNVMDHPLIAYKVTRLRDKNTTVKEFRELVNEIALLMGYEATRDLELKDKELYSLKHELINLQLDLEKLQRESLKEKKWEK